MSVQELTERLLKEAQSGGLFDWRKAREEILDKHKKATTFAERARCLHLYVTVMFAPERNNIAPEDIEEFRTARLEDYNTLLASKPIGNRTDENVLPDTMAELAAQKARLTEMAARKIRKDSDYEPMGPYSAYTIDQGYILPLRQFGTIAFGIGASVLMTNAITTGSRLAGFDFHALSPSTVIPVGALLIGLATAAAYRFGRWLFRCKVTWLLLIQIVVAAEFYPFATYYFAHKAMILDKAYPEFATPNSSRLRNNAISP